MYKVIFSTILIYSSIFSVLQAQDVKENLVGSWFGRPHDLLAFYITFAEDQTGTWFSYSSNYVDHQEKTYIPPIFFQGTFTWELVEGEKFDSLAFLFDEESYTYWISDEVDYSNTTMSDYKLVEVEQDSELLSSRVVELNAFTKNQSKYAIRPVFKKKREKDILNMFNEKLNLFMSPFKSLRMIRGEKLRQWERDDFARIKQKLIPYQG